MKIHLQNFSIIEFNLNSHYTQCQKTESGQWCKLTHFSILCVISECVSRACGYLRLVGHWATAPVCILSHVPCLVWTSATDVHSRTHQAVPAPVLVSLQIAELLLKLLISSVQALSRV